MFLYNSLDELIFTTRKTDLKTLKNSNTKNFFLKGLLILDAFAAAAAAKLLQSCPTLCDPIQQPTRLRLLKYYSFE